MDVSVVIVNWKVRDLLKRCLDSVFRETKGARFEVFVVDNDSRDGSVEMVAKEYPDVELIASSENLGFAAANNLAMERSCGDLILLLNPDTELKGDSISKMAVFMRSNPNAGICGPKLLNPDGSLQKSVRRFPDLLSQAMVMLKLHRLFPGSGPMRRYLADGFDYGQASRVEQVMGAAFMIRRSVMEKVGLLDGRYYIWFEEVDYCRRAADAGYEVWYTPDAEVLHYGGESFAQELGPVKQRMFNASLRLYFRKHHGLPSYIALVALHPLSMALAWTASLLIKPKAE